MVTSLNTWLLPRWLHHLSHDSPMATSLITWLSPRWLHHSSHKSHQMVTSLKTWNSLDVYIPHHMTLTPMVTSLITRLSPWWLHHSLHEYPSKWSYYWSDDSYPDGYITYKLFHKSHADGYITYLQEFHIDGSITCHMNLMQMVTSLIYKNFT